MSSDTTKQSDIQKITNETLFKINTENNLIDYQQNINEILKNVTNKMKDIKYKDIKYLKSKENKNYKGIFKLTYTESDEIVTFNNIDVMLQEAIFIPENVINIGFISTKLDEKLQNKEKGIFYDSSVKFYTCTDFHIKYDKKRIKIKQLKKRKNELFKFKVDKKELENLEIITQKKENTFKKEKYFDNKKIIQNIFGKKEEISDEEETICSLHLISTFAENGVSEKTNIQLKLYNKEEKIYNTIVNYDQMYDIINDNKINDNKKVSLRNYSRYLSKRYSINIQEYIDNNDIKNRKLFKVFNLGFLANNNESEDYYTDAFHQSLIDDIKYEKMKFYLNSYQTFANESIPNKKNKREKIKKLITQIPLDVFKDRKLFRKLQLYKFFQVETYIIINYLNNFDVNQFMKNYNDEILKVNNIINSNNINSLKISSEDMSEIIKKKQLQYVLSNKNA